jgi:hypothetical protein
MSLYQIVYYSRNRITGSADDIELQIGSILAAARVKNHQHGISGALLFNGSAFAQVLEGPLVEVERIFETIQCDDRHGDVVMLRNMASDVRIFSDWSMAYADPDAVHGRSRTDIDLDDAFADPAAGAPRIVAVLEQLILRSPPERISQWKARRQTNDSSGLFESACFRSGGLGGTAAKGLRERSCSQSGSARSGAIPDVCIPCPCL